MGWRNRPTFKEQWPEGVDYIMFIDECGDSSLKNIRKCIKNNKDIEDNNKYFTTTACVIKRSDFIDIKNYMLDIKYKHWDEGVYEYKDAIKRVCFHSCEIRGAKNAFSKNVIDREAFLSDLNMYMSDLKIDIFSATLDKENICRKYENPYNPYDICMNFILERFVKYYLNSNETAIIVLEARGKKDDKNLLEHIKSIIDNGTYYVSSNYFKKIKGVYFNPKWANKYQCKKSYFGLEIADLVSYPIHKYNVKGIKDMAFEIIENKVYGYPNYEGRGIKFF